MENVNEKMLEDLLLDEVHMALELYDNNFGDAYFLKNIYLNNKFLSMVEYMFSTSQLTLPEIEKCVDIIIFSLRVKENRLAKNNDQIRRMFSREQIDDYDEERARKLSNELALYLNKKNKLLILK